MTRKVCPSGEDWASLRSGVVILGLILDGLTGDPLPGINEGAVAAAAASAPFKSGATVP